MNNITKRVLLRTNFGRPVLSFSRLTYETETLNLERTQQVLRDDDLIRSVKGFENNHTFVCNYHITHRCYFNCEYCYSQYNDEILCNTIENDFEKQKMVFSSIKEYFNELPIRINISGGEPLIVPKLKNLVSFLIDDCDFKVSIISNGYLVNNPDNSQQLQNEIEEIISNLYSIGFSIDSLLDETNISIGRSCVSFGNKEKKKPFIPFDEMIDKVNYVRAINPDIRIKINTVIGSFNVNENMIDLVTELKPEKWSVVQLLNLFEVSKHGITEEEFNDFVERHISLNPEIEDIISVENNDNFLEGFLMVGPNGSFFQSVESSLEKNGEYTHSDEILKVGVENALGMIDFDLEKYLDRHRNIGLSAQENYYQRIKE